MLSSKVHTVILTVDGELLYRGALKDNEKKVNAQENFITISTNVELVTVGRHNIAFVNKDGSIHFMGKSKNNHFNIKKKEKD
jgi:hypothetical protein